MPFSPGTLPLRYVTLPGQAPPSPDADTGSYDFSLGGLGFRLATDDKNTYSRVLEQVSNHRFDNSLEPGEQSLSPLPWLKSQSSFHAGAGQRNLEQGFTAFQYQSEQVEHIRFDASQGVDPWTPGAVTRLPDCIRTGLPSNFSATAMVTGTTGGVDYAIVGGAGGFYSLAWSSGPDAPPVATAITLSGANYGGASNCNITSLATDGKHYYALCLLTVVGSLAGVLSFVIKGDIGSTSAPTQIYSGPGSSTVVAGVVGWSKERLIGVLNQGVYQLDINASANTALPTALYTHPNSGWTGADVADSPTGVLVAGTSGGVSSVLEFTLSTAGAAPTLTGGATVAVLPTGERIQALESVLGTFLAIGTSKGLRICTFDTYTGALTQGPLSVTTTAPVLALASRDRFVYGSYTNQQQDGQTGLVCVDVSYPVDASGRLAYAASLKPPSTAPTGLGAVAGVGLLPTAGRLAFLTPEGIHTEGNGPGTDGVAWLRTSRIRYDTVENKLFTLGRIRGVLDSAQIQVTGISPYNSDINCGLFGDLVDGDPGEFNLPSGLHEWIQLKFTLIGATSQLGSYQVKAIPAPQRQEIITLTALCFWLEQSRGGDEVPEISPWIRYRNLLALAAVGDEQRFVEFTNAGPQAQLVVIDQMAFESMQRPNTEDTEGGFITLKLRAIR